MQINNKTLSKNKRGLLTSPGNNVLTATIAAPHPGHHPYILMFPDFRSAFIF